MSGDAVVRAKFVKGPASTRRRAARLAALIGGPGPRSHPTRNRARTNRGHVLLLVLLLPLFGQTFHYIKALPPLWALSKAFPILSLPLVWPLLGRRGGFPLLPVWLLAFLWLVLVSSVMGIFSFDQDFLRGLTAQVKLLPMLYVFSFLGFLLILRPSVAELQRAFLWCGALTFLTLLALHFLAPASWYAEHYELGDAPLLSVDDRGYRIRMPMYFGLITLFFFYQELLTKRRLTAAVIVAVALALIVGVVRTRAVVLACVATLMWISFTAASPRWRIGAVVLAGITAAALINVPYVASAFDTGADSGFDVRRITVEKSIAFLNAAPERWIFGSGTISSLDPTGMARFFDHFFFLADISWLGIVFEFGLIGAAILLWLMVSTWLLGRQARRCIDAPLLAALQNYVLFVIIMSPLYPTITLQPGEIAVIAATFLYCCLLGCDAAGRRAPLRARPVAA